MSLKQHGGARPGAGRFRIRRTITKEAAQTLRLLAWRRYGRPTTDDEENALICQLIEEERQRVAPAPSAAALEASRTWAERAADEDEHAT